MSKPKGGLGRGLSALIPPSVTTNTKDPEVIEAATSGILEVSPDVIAINPHQPRKVFAPAQLEDLLTSIQEHGILQPLIVTKVEDGGYELIAGERRLRAAKMLGLKKVPVIVRSATQQQKLELALIENIQRQDLNPVEEAQAFHALIDQFSLRQEDVAKRVGKSRSHIANTLRLLELEEEILRALSEEKISRSHARTLLAETDAGRRKQLFRDMLSGGVTVREAEARAGHHGNAKKRAVDPNVASMEADLREALGTKVQIQSRDGSNGKIVIHFYSKEELKALRDRLE